MDFWKTIGRLLRRLYVGPPVIMISIAAAALGSYLVPLQYESSALIVLTTPTSGGTVSRDPDKPNGVTNPLLQFNDGLLTTAAILIQSLNTPDAQHSLGAPQDGPSKLTIDDGRSNPDLLGTNGPFIYLHAESLSATEARALVVRAEQRIRSDLIKRQVALNAPRSTFIAVVDVVLPSPAAPLVTNKLQIGGIVLAGGIALGMTLAYAIDRLRMSRRARARAAERAAPRVHGSVVPDHPPQRPAQAVLRTDRPPGDPAVAQPAGAGAALPEFAKRVR